MPRAGLTPWRPRTKSCRRGRSSTGLITALGADKIHNVIVARVPDARADAGKSAWLAPYASVARGAAVVLTHAPGEAVAEADVWELIRGTSIQPRTVTLLADYASIGCRSVEPRGGRSGRWAGRAAPVEPGRPVLGVAAVSAATASPAPLHRSHGTVPADPVRSQLGPIRRGPHTLESPGDASVFYARGLLRGALLAAPPRMLMIANSGVLRRPFCRCAKPSAA